MKSNIPLIHLFKTPLGYYFYETNRNEIVSTNEETYYALNDLLYANTNGDEPNQKSSRSIEALKNMGYLSSSRPQTIEHLATEALIDYFESKVEKITLQVTQDCNLRCRYCAYSDEVTINQIVRSVKNLSG